MQSISIYYRPHQGRGRNSLSNHLQAPHPGALEPRDLGEGAPRWQEKFVSVGLRDGKARGGCWNDRPVPVSAPSGGSVPHPHRRRALQVRGARYPRTKDTGPMTQGVLP